MERLDAHGLLLVELALAWTCLAHHPPAAPASHEVVGRSAHIHASSKSWHYLRVHLVEELLKTRSNARAPLDNRELEHFASEFAGREPLYDAVLLDVAACLERLERSGTEHRPSRASSDKLTREMHEQYEEMVGLLLYRHPSLSRELTTLFGELVPSGLRAYAWESCLMALHRNTIVDSSRGLDCHSVPQAEPELDLYHECQAFLANSPSLFRLGSSFLCLKKMEAAVSYVQTNSPSPIRGRAQHRLFAIAAVLAGVFWHRERKLGGMHAKRPEANPVDAVSCADADQLSGCGIAPQCPTDTGLLVHTLWSHLPGIWREDTFDLVDLVADDLEFLLQELDPQLHSALHEILHQSRATQESLATSQYALRSMLSPMVSTLFTDSHNLE
ncbi:uncharacterized protein BJ171DRAFT_572335, partial [Polychytrium aggregatum]|uniref:uncharacterized protein n=1 Tax=Polychytrium aggregatum TaxID=110093 RepID=UPI0022FE3B84